ncbi:MAG: transporter [Candidatus Sericytochromatia bacterium]
MAILFASKLSAQAQEAISPDRPDQTNSPHIVAPGTLQLETGWLYSFEQGVAGQTHTQHSQAFPQSMLRIGLLKPLELRLDYAGYTWMSQNQQLTHASGDPGLGIKYKWYDTEEGWLPAMGLEARLGLVLGPLSQVIQAADPSLKLLFENTLTEHLSIGYNLGLGSVSEKDDTGLLLRTGGETVRTHSFLYSVSLGIAWLAPLDGFVEIYGDIPLNGPPSQHALDAGLFYAISPDLKLDLAAGFSVAPFGSGFVGLGGSYRY